MKKIVTSFWWFIFGDAI